MALDIAGFDANIASWGTTHRDYMLTALPGDPALAAYYYDAARVFYQIGDYLNNVQSLSYYAAADAAVKIYRDYYCRNPGVMYVVPGYWLFTQGLRMHYERTGDVTSKETVINLSKLAAFCADWVQDAWLYDANNDNPYQGGSRETAFAFMAYLDAELLGEPRRPRTSNLVNLMLGHLDQWATGLAYTYVRPFMVALTGEALIRAVGANLVSETTVKTKLAAVFTYLNSATWNGAPINCYNYTDRIGTNPPDTWAASEDGLPAYDLGILISAVLQWMGGAWLTKAEEQFNSCVSGAYLVNAKQFNQSYRMAFNQLLWLDQQDAGEETSPPAGNTESRIASATVCLPFGWVKDPIPAYSSPSPDEGGDPVPPSPEPEPEPPPGFNPALWGTTVVWHMNAKDNSTVLDAGGAPCDPDEACATFHDSGGNSYDPDTQSTAGYRPTFKSAYVNTFNALSFDGGDGFGLANSVAGSISKNKDCLTFAWTLRHTDFTNAARILAIQAGAAAAFRIYLGYSAPAHNLYIKVQAQDAGSFTEINGSASYLPVLNEWGIYVVKFDFAGNKAKGYFNGDVSFDVADITSTGNTSNTDPTAGGDSNQFGFNYYGSGGITGQLTDFAVWNDYLSDSDCLDITDSLANQLGITI